MNRAGRLLLVTLVLGLGLPDFGLAAVGRNDAVYTKYAPPPDVNHLGSFRSRCFSPARLSGGYGAGSNGDGTYSVHGELSQGSFSLTWEGTFTSSGSLTPMSGHGGGTWHAVNLPSSCGGKAAESGRFTYVGTPTGQLVHGISGVVVRFTFEGFAGDAPSGSGGKPKTPPVYIA